MRMYSPEQLDLMAEAYTKALEKLSDASPKSELILKLVHEIGEAVGRGIMDCDKLASAALKRSRIYLDA